MRIYKIAKNKSFNKNAGVAHGEWWIIDGSAHFADGDIGDFNHEAYAIQHAQYMLMDDGYDDWETWKMVMASRIYDSIKENYDEDRSWEMQRELENDPEYFILEHIEESDIDETTFFVANGNHSDPRTWSMKELGWKRMAGNDITTWTLTSSDLSSIANGIWDAFQDEDLDNEKFTIEVASNNRMFWNVPVPVIESGDLRELSEYGSRSGWGVMSHSNKIQKSSLKDINDWLIFDKDKTR